MEEYQRKRDFTHTPEPVPAKPPGTGDLTFVVHKHAARSLHYDLRLEMEGVLKSWALPRGPSSDPDEKRLAVMVEDHPLDYADFEGVIPKGEYGAGQVIIWDTGIYVPVKGSIPFSGSRDAAEAILREDRTKGKIIIYFYGHKLKGEYTLIKMQRGENNWLLLKHRDEFAGSSRDILTEETSVVSGLTIDDLKNGKLPENKIASVNGPETISGARPSPFPDRITPMLATLAHAPFTGDGWFFEPKLDGYRTIALVNNGKVKLLSRNGLDVTDKYLAVMHDLTRIAGRTMVLDGEIIALDAQGKNCFQCLQNYLEVLQKPEIRAAETAPPVPLIYYYFDLLYLDGYDLTGIPLRDRKRLLQTVPINSSHVRPVAAFSGDGNLIYKAALDNGLEGIIAKHRNSLYEPGRRSHQWLKIKSTLSDEFVIGGYSRGQGNRLTTFGALLLGQYDAKGNLVYNGHVGTGFDERSLREILRKIKPLKIDECPFSAKPLLHTATTWLKPELVAEVRFSQRTSDGMLRAPVFLRLRNDKPAKDAQQISTINSNDMNDPVNISDNISVILQQLNSNKNMIDLSVEGKFITVNNLNKELWPAVKTQRALTKRDILKYLTQASPYLLRHLYNRLITLSRYPDGINGQQFFQKHWGHPLPDFVTRVPITTEHEGNREYMVCDNLSTLLWLGQLADIELHTWFSRITAETDRPEGDIPDVPDSWARYPDFMVFDLDPYLYSGHEQAGAEPELNYRAFARVCETAVWLKEVLDSLSLNAYLKTSGKTGLHVYVPIKRQYTYDEIRSAARTICLYVNSRHPRETTVEWAVEKRAGKIFLDFNQNTFGKTLASIYSPRPTPQATVSMPLSWSELGKVYPTDFTILNVPGILSQKGDLWENILREKRDFHNLLDKKSP